MPPRKTEKGRDALLEVREGLGGVGRPARKFGSCQEAHSEILEGSRCPPEWPGAVGRPSRNSWRGREALPEVQEGLGVPPGSLKGVGKGREALN